MDEEKKYVRSPITFGNPVPISPITFQSKGYVVKPISFVDRSKAISPISFVDKETDSSSPANFTVPENAVSEKTENSNIAKTDTIIQTQNISKESETAKIANYQLLPLRRRIYYNRDGAFDHSKTEFDLRIIIDESGTPVRDVFTIKAVEIDKIATLVGKRYPDAILYSKKDAAEIANSFRENCKSATIVSCYLDAGWQVIRGKHVYLHKGASKDGIEVMTPLLLPVSKSRTIGDLGYIFTKSFSIYKDFNIASVLILYSLLGVSYKLFDEAGYTPHFLLFITGKTGSFKTTIAKLLFTQLSDPRYRDFPRRIDSDTVTSLERALVGSGVDTVTLIDDYSPAKSQRSALDMADKLESIIRMVGDGSTKSRSNVALDDCRGEGVKGMVVLTGELRGKGLSSNLRCLYCEIEKDKVDLPTVTYLQQNTNDYCTLIQHFIYFLADNWDFLKEHISNHFEVYRTWAAGTLNARRLVDVVAVLCNVADILSMFLTKYCKLPENKLATTIEHMKGSVLLSAKRSELLSVEEEPALRFMRTLVDLIEQGKLSITSERPVELSSPYDVDGFTDANYFYLLPDNVYSKVTNYLKAGGLYFGIDRDHLGKLLCREGYAIPAPNGKNKQTYYHRIDVGNGRKIRFLKIPHDVMTKIQATADDKE